MNQSYNDKITILDKIKIKEIRESEQNAFGVTIFEKTTATNDHAFDYVY